jgi:hypothetical protein
MSAPATHLLDTDTLSEVIKDRDLRVRQAARQYLEAQAASLSRSLPDTKFYED